MSRRLIVSAVTAVALAGAALGAPAAQAAPARGATTVHASAKQTVTAPRSIRPGLVHLRNTGARALLVFGKKKAGAKDLVKYLNAQDRKTATKVFTKFDFVEVVLPHADDFLTFKRGTYFLADGSGDSVKASKIRTLSVTGKTSNAKRPASRAVTYDKRGLRPGSSAGRTAGHLRVLNAGTSPVLIEIVKVLPRTTTAQVDDFLAKPDYDKLDAISDVDNLSLTALVGGHHDVTVRQGIYAGRYLLLSVDTFAHDGGLERSAVSLVTAG